MFEKNSRILLFIIIIFAFLARLYPVLAPNVITPDGVLYIETAKMILSGEFKRIVNVSFFNLYPFMILLFQKVFSDWELAGRMVSVVFGTLGVIPIFFLIKRFLDVRLALIVSFFYTINPHLVEYSSDVLREPLFLSLFLASLWMGVEGLRGRRWLFLLLSAFFAGLAIFTRIEGVISIFLIILWALWLYRHSELTGKDFILRMAVFLIAFPLIFASPFFLLKERLGHWEFGLAGTWLPFLVTQYPSIDETVTKELALLKDASPQFKGFLDISLRNRYVTYLSEVLYKFLKSVNIVFFILILFGFIKRRHYPYKKNEIFFAIWFILAFLTSYLYVAKTQYLGTRHGLVMGIPAFLWAGIGYLEIVEKIRLWFKRMAISTPFQLILPYSVLLIIFVINIPPILAAPRSEKIELKKAGIYLKEMGLKDKRIATIPSLRRVIFYAEAIPVILSEGLTIEEIEGEIKKSGVDYLLLDRSRIDQLIADNEKGFAPHLFRWVEAPLFNSFKEYSLILYRIDYNER
ncbi:MAG TPA: hypothetical protein DDW17_00550 [Deltaproteobacteria bacterium]|nr:hypothetical protein [Deltaproteobacteria bacterium]